MASAFLGGCFRRLVVRVARNKAALAVARGILLAIYGLLTDGTTYRDLGTEHFAHREREHSAGDSPGAWNVSATR